MSCEIIHGTYLRSYFCNKSLVGQYSGRRGIYMVSVNVLSGTNEKQKGSNLYTGFSYKDVIRSIFRILVVNVTDVLVVNVTM